MKSIVLCNWFSSSAPAPCLPCTLLYPSSPVLLMACRPCRGAGRIWCCRSHKVRPPERRDALGAGSPSSPQRAVEGFPRACMCLGCPTQGTYGGCDSQNESGPTSRLLSVFSLKFIPAWTCCPASLPPCLSVLCLANGCPV